MMKSSTFAGMARTIAGAYKTTYMKGNFGGMVTPSLIASFERQYPLWYIPKRSRWKAMYDQNVFGFDCVCLIKGILWGWNGSKTEPWGGAVYQSNGVPDFYVDSMIDKYCTESSSDFDTDAMIPGEVVWLPGHAGIYIGNGLVAEATSAFGKSGVIITAFVKGTPYDYRTWKKHGKLMYVEYPVPKEKEKCTPTAYVCVKGDKGAGVFQLQALLRQNGFDIDVDGSFGSATDAALREYQRTNGLDVDGSCGPATWTSLLTS